MRSKFNIILFNPQIPPNTGNIIRLCSNTGSDLHLIEPLGFKLDEKSLRRASLDYVSNVKIQTYPSLEKCLKYLNKKKSYFITKFGNTLYSSVSFSQGDNLVFGSEISGLPENFLKIQNEKNKLYIPMLPKNRSLNLSNAVSICLYEAWRQISFS
ncbi:MAG: tRNA (uridine(34)/cytosine(34)/5-carboxymethylaminomethyluridine(34)-2'-O)-methyltransferase TrmL [Rickettsiales bacterium]|nr:tRNA (uridine(34)/cytosine(34)/5-carboxymethylaminomethyluridine(34)-2'-O)-methyltransferase TrmL [Rickettsiales bacterium]|tara:strand:- start:3603 stop:4067 length:465 start_codon:yes stop_codon:yes gene_type:complete